MLGLWCLGITGVVLAVLRLSKENRGWREATFPAHVVRVPSLPSTSNRNLSAPRAPYKAPQWVLDALLADVRARGVYDMHLRILEYKAGLSLTEKEHQRLVGDVMDFEHVRARLEQSLVTTVSFDETTLVLLIPAYPALRSWSKLPMILLLIHRRRSPLASTME